MTLARPKPNLPTEKRKRAPSTARHARQRAHRTQLDALARGDLFNIARLDFGTSKLSDTMLSIRPLAIRLSNQARMPSR